MQYRDERDALRGRVEGLEEQLAAARKELEDRRDDDRTARVEQIERQMAEARRVLDQLGRELDAVRGRPKRSLAVPLLVAATVLAGAAVAALMLGRSSSEVSFVPLPPVAPTLVQIPPPAPEPSSEPEPPTPASPSPERRTRTASATWKATVTRATGLPLAAGAACTVEAKLASPGDDVDVSELQVLCGGKPIYRSTDPLNGMSMFRSSVEEDSGSSPGTYLYAISYEDKGDRAGSRAEISLDSIRKVGAVWSDSAPAYRVELKLPYQSAPVQGEPLLDATSRALRRSARVTSSTGPSPVKAGARCTLRASPLARAGMCLTRLECGGRVIYGEGTTGVSECTVESNQVVRVHDGSTTPNGGDPAFELDLATGKVIVQDETKTGAWTTLVQLDPSG
ncbi:hypothetical protein SOCE26_102540 [Sorangium cellulosum]|uniref:Uncharacterized protein n=1 Tax=Sorangium cellulosum TaxID=56 RepID=A0A2L0FB05_SORCE|nr:hypothetical protein [Sorangium cellulosum]AUX48713.1 hypothetical protein SOCE26_102540 [Sorangium cellulosum]